MSELEFFFLDGVFKHKYIVTLKSGQMFGELGIMMNKPRAASIVAKTNTHFAVIPSSDYKLILEEQEKCIN
jgi:CRP-like cAMP-binding protein